MKQQSSKDTLQKLVPIFLLLAGLAVCGTGVCNLLRRADYEKTTASVQEIATASPAEYAAGSPLYQVYVNYTVDENAYLTDIGAYKKSYQVGKELAVLYNPENPADAVVSDRKPAVIMTVCGGVMLAVDAVLLVPLLRDVLAGNKKKEEAQETEG